MNMRCDIFCAVIDNLGDAGVCWRLARQLAREHGWRVRLWIDDAAALSGMRPGIDATADAQEADGVDIRRWSAPFPDVESAQVVIEAFACELPAAYLAAMARRPPVWLNLEYLSAEAWVAGCHGLPSPHPSLPLMKYFFFPGFTAGTGGLLRERDADFGAVEPAGFTASLFCYENRALPGLLDAWSAGAESMRCRVAEGLARRQVEEWLGEPFAPGAEACRGALILEAVPFLPQVAYDRLLGGCHLNFVRGEDSFVRAQWAGRPFVWQLYPQAGDDRRRKLEAFLALYAVDLEPSARRAADEFWLAWNEGGDAGGAWSALRAALPQLHTHAGAWARRIAAPGDLAANLVRFCLERI